MRELLSKLKNRKGSATVEACIAFPAFLCVLFILMFFIKLACISITLDHAVNETAKQLATSAYPVSFLNELEDDLAGDSMDYKIPSFEDEKEKIAGYLKEGTKSEGSGLITKLLSGEISGDDLFGSLKGIAKSVGKDVTQDAKDGLRAYLIQNLAGSYYEIKSEAKYKTAGGLLEKFLEGSFVKKDDISLVLVELPQSITEYDFKKEDSSYTKKLEELGCRMDRDNVIVAVEYRARLPVPFYKNVEFVSRHAAVERAWIHGGNGVYTAEQDRDDKSEDGSTSMDESLSKLDPSKKDNRDVYVTRTGTHYHDTGCRYLRTSRIVMKLADAKKRNYDSCSVCVKAVSK